ncbi:hypothetical protein [Geodermatophilus sp. SYSU D00710]
MRQGLDDFTAWATGQGFTIISHDDVNGPVRARPVFETVRDAVMAGDLERLFIFFGGHGLAPGVGDDLWLLSEAAEDGGEAVNVAKSVSLARHCGIPHVAFFADACRTPPEVRFLGVVGRPIFPLERIPKVRVQVDQFYATISGDAALERVPSPGTEGFGIFSRCLMEALRGVHDEILTPVDNGPASHALLADSLGDYLWSAVPTISSQQTGITQYPDCIPTSAWRPNALAWFDRSPRASAPIPVPMPAPRLPPTGEVHIWRSIEQPAEAGPNADLSGSDYEETTDAEYESAEAPDLVFVESEHALRKAAEAPSRRRTPWRPPADPNRRALIAELADQIVSRPGRGHFETRVGASVTGAEVIEAWVNGRPAYVFEEDDAWHVRGVPDQPGAVFLNIRTADDVSWLATALLPGFVTTVTVGPGGVDSVVFAALAGDHLDEDLRSLAVASAALRTGDLGFVDDHDVVRLLDQGHPTMTVLTAYALDRAGQEDEVRYLFERYRDAGRPIPFDLALLAEALAEAERDLVPEFPLMTRGWALTDQLPSGDRLLTYARPRLGRTAWTTFTQLSPEAIVALSETEEGVYA